jgi:hypothetical protein
MTPVLRIDESLDVAASPDVVWQVITDFDRYGEWNPFVVACRSTLVVGAPIEMRVRLVPWLVQPQRETVFAHEPGRRICYGVDGGTLNAIASRRCHEVTLLGDGHARYVSRFALSGWLAPVVRALFGSRLEQGFHAMSVGIRDRAERLAAAGGRC